MSGRERDTKLNVIIAAWMTGHQGDMGLTSHWSMKHEQGLSLAQRKVLLTGSRISTKFSLYVILNLSMKDER